MTAYEMRISDWSSDVCSSDLAGVFLGRQRGRYLRHDGPEHVMAFAPTRSGKGVGLVIPTLLSWTGSAVIHDIKGENWQLTAGWRARFSNVLLFNPDRKSVGEGKSGAVRGKHGGRRFIKKKKQK